MWVVAGYSGADMANLCPEAVLGPIRSIPFQHMEFIQPEQVTFFSSLKPAY
jgi:hypothetical protein